MGRKPILKDDALRELSLEIHKNIGCGNKFKAHVLLAVFVLNGGSRYVYANMDKKLVRLLAGYMRCMKLMKIDQCVSTRCRKSFRHLMEMLGLEEEQQELDEEISKERMEKIIKNCMAHFVVEGDDEMSLEDKLQLLDSMSNKVKC